MKVASGCGPTFSISGIVEPEPAKQRIEDGLAEGVHLFPRFSRDLFAFAVGWLGVPSAESVLDALAEEDDE